MAGNLLQRPRCWYYRSQHVDCWLSGGEGCPAVDGRNEHHAIFGSSPCVAVHPSDLASALVAADAAVSVTGPGASRELPIAELFAAPTDERRTETTLAADELVTEIVVPDPAPGTRSTYRKAMDRKVWAFALVGAAVALRMDGAEVAEARIVLGGVANVPWRLSSAEDALAGRVPDDETVTAAVRTALDGAEPLEHNRYKVALAARLVRRAVLDLAA